MSLKPKRKDSDYLDLSDKPKGKDGLPIGSACVKTCLKPPVKSNWAHCGVCHLSFRAVGLFSSHRHLGRCINPTVLGLTEVDRLWSTPEGHEQRAALAARSENMRAGRTKPKTDSDPLQQTQNGRKGSGGSPTGT